MRNFRDEGIIIKRRNFGEADRMVTVFTKNHGKITVKAKGVRRITSRRASHIELLNQTQISLYKGRSISTLIEAQSLQDFSGIKENLTKVGFAYHLCELIDGLCPDQQENRAVYHLFLSTLNRLEYLNYSSSPSAIAQDKLESRSPQSNSTIQQFNNDSIVSIIHEFEIELLSTLGFFPRYRPTHQFNTTSFIENILERRLKSRQILSKFS